MKILSLDVYLYTIFMNMHLWDDIGYVPVHAAGGMPPLTGAK